MYVCMYVLTCCPALVKVLEEMLDNGFPLTTELNILKVCSALIFPYFLYFFLSLLFTVAPLHHIYIYSLAH